MELTIESIFTAGGLVGNLSYILLIISMAMRDIFWLRALAILSGIAGLCYDVVWLHNPVGAFWEACFILVNLLQWLWLLYEKKRSLLTPPQSLLRDQVFPVLSSLDFLKLLATASRRKFENGQVLVNKGSEVTRLYLVEHGEAIVALGDMEISRCLPGDFIGEIGFFNRVPATATVTASNNLECLVFDCAVLHRLLQKNPQLERGVTVALNANLATKLIRNNETGLAV
ncbi:MAG: cyclic nucleotide-binding domain-containing protein [Gammaproteobacteria bacterium]